MSRVEPVVVVVVADEELAGRYGQWLATRWPVETATDPEAAHEVLDDAPAVVLVDRSVDGSERFLDRLGERDPSARVGMLSSDEPAVDAAALGVDDVLVGSIDRDALLEATEALALLVTYDELIETFYDLAAERVRLLADRAAVADDEADAPGDDQEYRELCERLVNVRAAIDEVLADLSDHDGYVDRLGELLDDGTELDDALLEP